MKIKYLYSAFGGFGKQLAAKYGLLHVDPRKHTDEPCFFFGLYGAQVERVLAHRGLSVIIWAGTDALFFIKNKEYVEKVRAMPNVRVIAISEFIAQDMEKIGFDYVHLPIIPVDNSDIEPKPLGDCMYVYKPTSAKYNPKVTQEVMKRLPDIKVIEGHPNLYNREEMLDVYERCFVALRPLVHDGCSNTVAEMGLMGRPSIWNGGSPSSIGWDTVDDIVIAIKRLYEARESWNWEGVAKVCRDYYDVGDAWLHTKFYE